MVMQRCVNCQSDNLVKDRTEHAGGLGVTSVTLTNVPVVYCGDCGEEYAQYPGYTLLLQHAVTKLCELSSTLTGEEVAFLRKWLGWRQDHMATNFGCHTMTISKWERGKCDVSPMADRLLRACVWEMLGYKSPMELAFKRRHIERPVVVDLEDFAARHSARSEKTVDFGTMPRISWGIGHD